MSSWNICDSAWLFLLHHTESLHPHFQELLRYLQGTYTRSARAGFITTIELNKLLRHAQPKHGSTGLCDQETLEKNTFLLV